MPRRLPQSGFVISIGIITLIVAIIEFGCGGIGAIANLFIASEGPKMPAIKLYIDYLNQNAPSWSTVVIARSLANMLLAIILGIVAVMMFVRVPFAKVMAIGYAAMVIPVNLAYGIYQMAVLHPVVEEFSRLHPNFNGTNRSSDLGSTIGDVASIVFHIVFAIALVVCFFIPMIAEHFTMNKARRREYDEEDGDDRDELN